MIGYIYSKETMEIVTRIDNVISCDEENIIGENSRAKLGTGEYIITNLEFNEGDTLSEEVEDERKIFMTL